MGSSLDTRRAGTTLKNKPIPPETLTARVIAISGTVGLKAVSIPTIIVPLIPMPVPIKPPVTERITASIINYA